MGGTLRLNFEASGSAPPQQGGGVSKTSVGDFAVGSNVNQNPSGFARSSVNLANYWDGAAAPRPLVPGGPWDSLFADPFTGDFSGSYHLDIPIIPGGGYTKPGGFYYAVTSQVIIHAGDIPLGTSVSFGAEDPTQFLSITLPDKGNVTPESLGVSVTFDSGIDSPNLTAVPEPASLTLLCVGIAGLVGYRWRRRKLPAV